MSSKWVVLFGLGLPIIHCAASAALAAEDAAARTASYRERIEPLIVRYCHACHAGAKPKGDLALDVPAMAEDRELWQRVVEKLSAEEMPPEGKPQPSTEDRSMLVSWFESGLGHGDCHLPRDPGRVTMRRLNRAEYRNTVRDLLGVDFQGVDDFPSDDVGYGFDNIGDVLSLSPILLEKYLAAAKKIVGLAIGADDRPNLIDNEQSVGGTKLDGGAHALYSDGEVRNELQSNGAGDYIFRVRAHADQAGPDPARMSLRVGSRELRSFDVKAAASDPQEYEAWFYLDRPRTSIAVAFTNDYYDTTKPAGQQDRNLIVERIEIVGPMPASCRQVMVREPTPETRLECAREVIGRLATRAFRRPVRADEIDRLLKFVELATHEGESYEAGISLALEAILVSPHFLFRIELDGGAEDPAIRRLNDFEVATRLSYFLWSSMPDEELFALAREGQLRRDGHLEAQIQRMLKDHKAQSLVENFVGQWLQLRDLKTIAPDPASYPEFDDALRTAMQRETELFVATLIDEDRSILDLIDADFTFLNERLARHYGIAGVRGETFRRVSLAGTPRGGVLTQASVLAVTSNPTRTSPVKRGKWVLENILGATVPPQPPGIPALEESSAGHQTASLRVRMEQHRARAECAACHRRMDPLGFGLENFDGIGTWRTEDGKFPIDASGTLPDGITFSGPRELKAILRERKNDVARCLAEKMLTYALGRGLEYYDKCAVDDIVSTMAEHDYRFSSLIAAIVASDPFLNRKGDQR